MLLTGIGGAVVERLEVLLADTGIFVEVAGVTDD